MEYALKNEDNKYESIIFKANVIQTEGTTNIKLLSRIEDNEFVTIETIHKNNTITKIDNTRPASFKLLSDKPFVYTVPYMKPRYSNKRKIEDYLYEITYGNIDYDYAYKYFRPISYGGCSSIRNGNFFGRNFDWLYNNQVQFVVHTPSSLYHYGVLGIAGLIPGIEQGNVDEDDIIIDGVDMFKLLPFYLLDGINERGLFCTHNIVPLDNKEAPTREIRAKKEERERICIPMLVRFILDKFSDAKQAIAYITDYTTIFFPDDMIDAGYQSHFMIGDKRHTYIVEFINGEIIVVMHDYITNFNIGNVMFNKDMSIDKPYINHGVDKYANGIERWDIIRKMYGEAKTLDGMRNILNMVRYSNCYDSDKFWYSEIVRMEDDNGDIITVDTDPMLCTTSKNKTIENYRDRDRDNPKIWITSHSSIYDVSKQIIFVKNQENDSEHVFIL